MHGRDGCPHHQRGAIQNAKSTSLVNSPYLSQASWFPSTKNLRAQIGCIIGYLAVRAVGVRAYLPHPRHKAYN
jgi:hypothetical protein